MPTQVGFTMFVAQSENVDCRDKKKPPAVRTHSFCVVPSLAHFCTLSIGGLLVLYTVKKGYGWKGKSLTFFYSVVFYISCVSCLMDQLYIGTFDIRSATPRHN